MNALSTNLIIGGALAAIGVIGLLVFWIIAIVKAFQAKETVWGVLTILFSPVGLIFFFVKGLAKLGIWNVIFLVVYFVGFGMIVMEVQSNPELRKQLEQLEQTQPGTR